MDIDWSFFVVTVDDLGDVEVIHDERQCQETISDGIASTSITELMKLAEEHLKTCPIWTNEPS